MDPDWTFQSGIDPNQGWTISPDGSMVAFREFTGEGYDVWVKQLDTGPRSRLTFGEAHERKPVWATSGRDVTFLSDRGGNLDVWSRPADGTTDSELLLDLDASVATVDWNPDGEWLLLRTSTGNLDTSERNILAWRPDEDSVPAPLFSSPYRETGPAVSPDGRWLAYASDETGRYEIYVRPFPDVSAGRWVASIGGGRNPQWAHSGQELFFQGPTQEMMVVDFETTTSEFVAGTPEVLFEADRSWLVQNLTGLFYDVAPDDQRFLIAAIVIATSGSTDDGPPLPSVVLVNNFMEELRQRVGS